MRVAIDARAYGWAGVGRYTRNLIKHLLLIDDETEYLVLLGASDEKRFWDDQEAAGAGEERVSVRVVESSYYSWQEQTKFLWQLSKIKADLWHFTHFNVPYFFNRPYVVTIHDVTRFIFPGQIDQRWLKQVAYEQVFKHAVERAGRVICVSKTTRADLAGLPIQIPEMQVIYEGVDEMSAPSVNSTWQELARLQVGGADPYLLYVGVWMEHKNLKRMLQAVAQVWREQPNLKLVMTGRPRPGYVDVPKLAREAGLSEDVVIYLGHVPENVLVALYAEAACLLMPSLYEGFGLPALEAAALGTPVVASNVSSLPEVLGRQAIFVNPEYVDGMAAGIREAMGQDVVKKAGSDIRERFSWQRCAEQTRQAYNVVLD